MLYVLINNIFWKGTLSNDWKSGYQNFPLGVVGRGERIGFTDTGGVVCKYLNETILIAISTGLKICSLDFSSKLSNKKRMK